ncbi:hypothetical protein HPB48_026345 [Haemaphysalis longicornis]|uniref:Uncharacterized protein n=1 Tax=Haemaphysalis longicornis TaxID=44386 RepID=A0A9J6H0X0_HAELO|nr:hypothetical protein HPB48_026345 [Haemaphysalis longicornis]
MLSLPPRATHRLHTRDVSFLKTFKTPYNQACREWIISHSGDRIPTDLIGGLVETAFERSGNIRNITVDFKSVVFGHFHMVFQMTPSSTSRPVPA